MRHIPNTLSAFRIVLIPFLVYFVVDGNLFAGAVILIISGVTDLLDGFLARRFGWVSQLGKVLDPIADKMTQITVCVLFAINFRRYWAFYVVLIAKEFLMLVLGGYLVQKGIKLEGARWFGKVTTVLFYVSMILIALIPDLPEPVLIGLLLATTLCALTAAALYVPEFIQYRRRAAQPKEEH